MTSARGCRSPCFAYAIELRGRPDEETAPGDCGGRERHLVQAVPCEQLVFRTCLNHERLAVLAQQENPAVVRPGRCRKRAGVTRQALPPVDFFSGPRVVCRQEAAIELSGNDGSSAATPACSPRNCGQCCADTVTSSVSASTPRRAQSRFMARSMARLASVATSGCPRTAPARPAHPPRC